MSVRNAAGIDREHFRHIEAALRNFNERHPTDKSAQIQDVANSQNPGRWIDVTCDVHTHPPFRTMTQWFDFRMFDGYNTPEEFHVYVQARLWPDVLLFECVSNGDPAFANLNPPPPGPPPTSIGSYWNTLAPANLYWF